MSKATFYINLFADKVRLMNQTKSKALTLTADEAQKLHSDIFDLLANAVALTSELEQGRSADSKIVSVVMGADNKF